jgi:glycosyltransferase involved in cell wall biosynthesis
VLKVGGYGLNVWIVAHYANTPGAGGSLRYFYLSKSLVDRGHRVTVFAANYHHAGQTSLKGVKTTRIVEHSGVRFVLLPTSPYMGNGLDRVRNVLQFTWGAWRRGPKLAGDRPDVVIGSSVHPFAAWAGQRLARRYGVPFVLELTDIWPEVLIDMGAFGPRHPVAVALRRLVGFLYQRAALIVPLLPYAHEHIEQFGVPHDRVFYLPSGVDLSAFPATKAPAEPNPFTLIYVGSHGMSHGLHTLLRAAAELEREPAARPVSWRLIGYGYEKPALEREAAELGLRSVRFEEGVPKERLPTLLAEADGLVFSFKDLGAFGYGISPHKLFDYLAAQRPIIFSCGARNDPVAEAKAGLSVPPEDPQAMAEAIRQLVELPPDERAEMGLRGRRYVEAYHDYERLGERLEKALKDLVVAA